MTEILEIFSLFLNTDKFQKCQTDNKKSSKSFSDLLLSLAALVAAGIRFLWLVRRIVEPELELTVN